MLAGLRAEGTTEVQRVYHLDRGYERWSRSCGRLGADITPGQGLSGGNSVQLRCACRVAAKNSRALSLWHSPRGALLPLQEKTVYMDCPGCNVEMADLEGEETTLRKCGECGGLWIDVADLNRLLLHNNLPGLESLGGKVDAEALTGQCPECQVDLVRVDGGDRAAPAPLRHLRVVRRHLPRVGVQGRDRREGGAAGDRRLLPAVLVAEEEKRSRPLGPAVTAGRGTAPAAPRARCP